MKDRRDLNELRNIKACAWYVPGITALEESDRCDSCLQLVVNAVIEQCAVVAANVKDGYSANIGTSEDDQKFGKDPDGPWVLNSDVAAAIRNLKREIK